VVREGRIRTENIYLGKKVFESSEPCKDAKKEWSVKVEFGRKTFFWEKKVLESSETCKDAKKEWSRMVEFGRKNFLLGKKRS